MNAIQTVQAVRYAQDQVHTWTPNQTTQVNDAMPRLVRDKGHTGLEWAITVALLRKGWETPAEAAQRLARYMVLHAERFDHTPTLASLRHTV